MGVCITPSLKTKKNNVLGGRLHLLSFGSAFHSISFTIFTQHLKECQQVSK